MSRPTTKQKGKPISYFLAIYDASGDLIAPDSTPTVDYYSNSSSPIGSLSVVQTSTPGMYTVSGSIVGENVGDFYSFIETAVISGDEKINVFAISVEFSQDDLLDAIYGTNITSYNLNGSAGLMLKNINETTVVKMYGMLEQDQFGGEWRWTADALAEAPSGGGGGGDATEANQQTIIATLATKSSQASVDDVDSTLALVQSELTGKSSQASVDLLQSETASILAISNKLDETLENDGAGGQQFTTTALENSPGTDLTGIATIANQQTIETKVDAKASQVSVNSISSSLVPVIDATSKLDTTLESNGAGGYRYTVDALANAPSGGGGGGDATEANQQTIIASLATKSSQASVDNVSSNLDSKASQASVDQVATTTTSVLAISNKLDSTLQNDGLGGNQFTVKALENAPSGGGGGGDATLANQQTIIAAVGALNDFDPANDPVAQVTSVSQVTSNLDMRGTDGANQVAPDNAGVANTLAAVGALKDFDPANDVVSQVSSVTQVTSNLDMRGTDGANQVAPDNSGIASANDALAEVAKINVEYTITNQAGDSMNVTKTEA